jgi:hypothetical protein
MREILGRRRMTRSTLRNAALTCATRWRWPVLPGTTLLSGASARSGGRGEPLCSCGDRACVVPGAHPAQPDLLAATTDARMVGWWWDQRPDASLILATGAPAAGRRSPCALSLPAAAGARALAEFDRLGLRVGPVLATPTRFALLVEAYGLEELGDLLYAQDRVPSSLRFHGEGGYVALPPTPAGGARVRWERPPAAGRGAELPRLPRMEPLLDILVEASAAVPDTGSRLAY